MIAAVFLVAALGAAPAPPDGTYTYAIDIAGQISNATVTVKRDSNGLHVSEAASFPPRSDSASLTLDPVTLTPISYQGTYDLQSPTPTSVTFAFNLQGVSVTIDGQSSQSISPISGAPKFVVLDGAQPSGFVMLPAIAALTSDTTMTAVMGANASAYPITIARNLKVTRPAGVPAGDTSISLINPTALTVWYDPRTFVMDQLDVPMTNVIETLIKRSAAVQTTAGNPMLSSIVRH